jgi:peptidoglycan/xylan/chitin deacetylase (PgdA/CDA1 family)
MSFGPHGSPRAVVLSFDNLGEASDLERGTIGAQPPLGRDPSVTVVLPKLLDELDALELVATFFIEALNCELYPHALREIAARGHELGVHGWRHETWAQLPRERERELLQRAGDAFRGLGLAAHAFRPPGGEPTARTDALLRELGYRWWSPVGETVTYDDGLSLIPFDWDLVDAYHLMERFAEVRARRGAQRATQDATAVAQLMLSSLAGARGLQTVILHPFLMLDEAWWEGARRVLATIAELGRTGQAWTVPGREVAALLEDRAHGAG